MRFIGFVLAAIVSLSPASAQQPYWQCAAFARQFSGIGIIGDAWTWWGQAQGRYERGDRPRVGAVMFFEPTAATRLGHVATVTALRGTREVNVTHANWSPINGTRGQIERDVLVRDVSAANDWSQVRVWYAPLGDLGTSAWPVGGFIYPDRTHPLGDAERFAARAAEPRLVYARLEQLDGAPRRTLIDRDVLRLARVEDRRATRSD